MLQEAGQAGSALISDLRARLVGDARALDVLADQAAQPGTARTAAGADGQAIALTSWMCTFGSRDSAGEFVGRVPLVTIQPTSGRAARPGADAARQSSVGIRGGDGGPFNAVRAVMIVAQPRCSRPHSAASSGDTSGTGQQLGQVGRSSGHATGRGVSR